MFIKTYLRHQLEKNLLLSESLTTPWTNELLVVKGDEMVGHLPRKFSRIVWYFLARSGEISVEVIGRRRGGRTEVPWQFQFNSSNKVKWNSWKNYMYWRARVGFRTVLKILTNGSFRSHRKEWSTTGFVMFNLCLLKVFNSILWQQVYSPRKEWSRV